MTYKASKPKHELDLEMEAIFNTDVETYHKLKGSSDIVELAESMRLHVDTAKHIIAKAALDAST